jgi:LDH2 family malate/lactate/ureidoglycolate dehydrogenase
VLSWSSFWKDVYSKWEPQVWHMFMAIDISRFMEIWEFKEKIGKLIVMLKDSHKENSEVFIHWEKEYITKKRNLEEWISFENEYISMLEKLWAEHGIVLSI